MPKLKINGKEIEVQAGITLIQACEIAGIEIPRFCYHDRLSIAGNCRMCLVEVEKSPKPVASCAMPVSEGMVVHTDSAMVKKAREGVMEFLLINHPLDCPICDQAGECDLQDQAHLYSRGETRYEEHKRAVIDKDWGPLVKTQMTRCIHCTRCVRFLTEVAGIEELGATGRGEHTEVGTYIKKAVGSEMSGNIIDLCPVGALTSKPYAFKARSWELKKTETIDVLDAVGSNIRVDSRGLEILRILPRLNENINEEWISDKTRFAYDGLKCQRLDAPMIKKEGKLVAVSWEEALNYASEKLKSTFSNKIAAFVGDLADCESIMVLKDLLNSMHCYNLDCRTDGAKIDAKKRQSYIFNSTISGIEKSDLCLLIGTNPRYEASIINTRIRKRWSMGNFKVSSIGPKIDLTYPVAHLGNDLSILKEIYMKNDPFGLQLVQAKYPMIILGSDVVTRPDGAAILHMVDQICRNNDIVRSDWNGYNLLQKAASRVGALDLGFVPEKNGKSMQEIYDAITENEIEVVYLLGADDIDMKKLGTSFVIYQGHHGDRGAERADIILPGAAYTEKNSTYVNTEGRAQRAAYVVSPPGDAKEDRLILQELAKYCEVKLNYNSLSELRNRMIEIAPHFKHVDFVTQSNWQEEFGVEGEINYGSLEIGASKDNYYMSNPIARSSKTMAECIKTFVVRKNEN
jgi:NADH-quinone oxidoreductase subunit G